MANLGTFIDGAYTATYNAVAIGPTRQGFSLRFTFNGQAIDRSDQWGDTYLDYIYRGGSCRMSADAMEYKAGTITPIWPWGAIGTFITTTNPIGRRASDVASTIILTSTANTPAATSPASLTATYAIIAEGQELALDFTSELREVPLIWRLLPYTSSGSHIWFSTT